MKESIEKSNLDLLSAPVFSYLLKDKLFLLVLRVLVAGLFFYAIAYGFIYPTKEGNLFTTGVLWNLFWPLFMVISLSTFGRIFCGVCPHAFIGKYVTKYGLKKKIPAALANPFIGLSILVLGYWLIIYIFDGSYSIPLNAATLFLSLTIFAILSYYIFKDMAYCKYFCPIGSVTKVFSKISFTKLETRIQGCVSCKTFNCAKACSYNLKPFTFDKKNSMEDCTLCMDCATQCDNVAFSLKKPSSALFKNFKTQKVEVWTVLILTAILSFGMIIKHALNRTAIADNFIWNKAATHLENFIGYETLNSTGLSVFIFVISSILVIYAFGVLTASLIMKTSFKNLFYCLGYSLIPLFVIGGLSHVLEMFFISNASNLANGIIQAFSLGFSEVQPLATRKDSWVKAFMIFTHIAYIWAFILVAARLKLVEARTSLKVLAFPFASFVVIAYMGLNFYTGYVFKTHGVKQKVSHHAAYIKNKTTIKERGI